jgi:hypothetical protein
MALVAGPVRFVGHGDSDRLAPREEAWRIWLGGWMDAATRPAARA